MKKIKILVVLLAVAGAVTAKVQKDEPQYFYNPSTQLMELITGDGICNETSLEVYCKYERIENAPNDGEPEHYQEVPGSVFKKIWVPSAK